MKLKFSSLAVIGLLVWIGSLSSNAESDMSFEDAKWIWHEPTLGETVGSFYASVRYFRAEVSLPESPRLKSAEIIITCDNLFVLYLNGRPVGESSAGNDVWRQVKRFDLTSLLSPGRVVFAVEAINTLPGPSGLLVKFVAELENDRRIELVSDTSWKTANTKTANWEHLSFDDQKWDNAVELTEYGGGPWNRLDVPPVAEPGGDSTGTVHKAASEILSSVPPGVVVRMEPSEDFYWPDGVVFVGDDCSLYRPVANTGNSAYDSLSVTIFNPRKARTFPEHDLPAPMKVGHTLKRLKPAQPGVVPEVLVNAGVGAIGSPSVSFDGEWIYFSMAFEDDSFFHIYRIHADGGSPEQLTDGPFFDIDPAELPDGRIVFTSTRKGTFEEYHSPPSRALFAMNPDGTEIQPVTNTIIFDNEPEVLADGRILFIRSDNFFDRGKVETRLQAAFPDGTHGYTEFGLDMGPEYGGRLRAYYCGSPAPMPDGRVAFVSNVGITVGRPGEPQEQLQHFSLETGDVAALPDGRLLCTLARKAIRKINEGENAQITRTLSYEEIGILDLQGRPTILTSLYDSNGSALHSPVYLGARPKPPVRPKQATVPIHSSEKSTGLFFCQNARFTKNTTAGWDHVRAIRVIAGKGLTTRSSHSYIVHAGNETVELGVVPLAPDGSFCIEVPADTPIAFQAVDAEGRSELNEMSWIYVRPGERRACVGCHQPRQAAPLAKMGRSMAMMAAPVQLLGNGQPLHYRGNNAAVTGMMEMQFDRFREVAGINRHGETANPMATIHDEVEALIEQLQMGDADHKISAAQRLAIFRDPKAAHALTACLDDAHREVRLAATIALACCGTRESVPRLLQALSDYDPLVAQGSAMALENLTGHREKFNPFNPIEKREQQADTWRAWFADTTWEAIETMLTKHIEEGNRDEVRRAAVALGHIGETRASAALRQYVQTEQSNNPYPEWRGAGHQGDNARFNSLSPVNPRTLQAVTRAIGYLGDVDAVPMLSKILSDHSDPDNGNLFLAEAAAEALGRIGTPEVEKALIDTFSQLKDYPTFTYWYGDHPALMACHSSPIHYFILEALDAMGSTGADAILPHIIRSVPTDPDRALMLPNDDYETIAGRVLRRHAAGPAIIETCLALLGDPSAAADARIEKAISTVIRCWAGHPCSENRAAQILSLTCRDRAYAPRIQAALMRYSEKNVDIKRVFETGIPEILVLPVKNWVCFYLARALGNLADPQSVDTLIVILEKSPAEAASGRPDPLGPGNLFIHNDLTPCWRAAVAWALGQIGDPKAAPVLLGIVRDLDNAPDTRHAAAEALGHIADPATLETIRDFVDEYPEMSTRNTLARATSL